MIDYRELKKESLANSKYLKSELQDINAKLNSIEDQYQLVSKQFARRLEAFEWDNYIILK